MYKRLLSLGPHGGVTHLMDELLHLALQTPPLELHSDELVAGHHGADLSGPVRAHQGPAARLGRLVYRRVLRRLVVLRNGRTLHAGGR